jgi:transcription-repair coupling factor (superfamily II helicase)
MNNLLLSEKMEESVNIYQICLDRLNGGRYLAEYISGKGGKKILSKAFDCFLRIGAVCHERGYLPDDLSTVSKDKFYEEAKKLLQDPQNHKEIESVSKGTIREEILRMSQPRKFLRKCCRLQEYSKRLYKTESYIPLVRATYPKMFRSLDLSKRGMWMGEKGKKLAAKYLFKSIGYNMNKIKSMGREEKLRCKKKIEMLTHEDITRAGYKKIIWRTFSGSLVQIKNYALSLLFDEFKDLVSTSEIAEISGYARKTATRHIKRLREKKPELVIKHYTDNSTCYFIPREEMLELDIIDTNKILQSINETASSVLKEIAKGDGKPYKIPKKEETILKNVNLFTCYTSLRPEVHERFIKFKEDGIFREPIILNDEFSLNPGDIVRHIRYGHGMYEGLSMRDDRIILNIKYKDDDIIFVDINEAEKFLKPGKEGASLNRIKKLIEREAGILDS